MPRLFLSRNTEGGHARAGELDDRIAANREETADTAQSKELRQALHPLGWGFACNLGACHIRNISRFPATSLAPTTGFQAWVGMRLDTLSGQNSF